MDFSDGRKENGFGKVSTHLDMNLWNKMGNFHRHEECK